MPDESDNLTASRFPFAGDDDATRRAIDTAVLSVDDLIHKLVRQSFPKINRADQEDLVQHIRIYLSRYTARKFDASRSKWSTLAYTAIANQCRARLRIKRRERRHEDVSSLDLPAASEFHDSRVESLARTIIADPRRFGLTKTQAKVLIAVTSAQPGTQLKEVAVSLGYARATSLSSVLQRIKAIISNIDVEGFDVADVAGHERTR